MANKQSFSTNKQSFSTNKNLSNAQNLDSRDARIKQSFSTNKQSFSTNKQSFSTNKQSFSTNKNLSNAQNLDSRDARIKQSFSTNNMANWIIVVAGGRGMRMNVGFNRDPRSFDRGSLILAQNSLRPRKGFFAQNKIFAKLGKLPIIYWTLSALEKSKAVDKVLILAVSADIPRIKRLVKGYKFKKVVEIIPAGKSRQASTLAALESVKDKVGKSDLVGVHNAVNPFVREKEIEDVFLNAKKFGAALLAQAARDTVKITDGDGLVKETPVRQNCWYAQTPQVATFANMYRAHMEAKAAGFVGTDDSQLLERVGIRPKIVPCSNLNFKITFREDLVMAEQIVKSWRAQM